MSKKLPDQASASASTEEPLHVDVTVSLQLGLGGPDSLPAFTIPLPATLICSEDAALAGSTVQLGQLSTQDLVALGMSSVAVKAVIIQCAEENPRLSAEDLPLAVQVTQWEVEEPNFRCTVQSTQDHHRLTGTPWPPFAASSLEQLGLLPSAS